MRTLVKDDDRPYPLNMSKTDIAVVIVFLCLGVAAALIPSSKTCADLAITIGHSLKVAGCQD